MTPRAIELVERFVSGFPERRSGLRTIGREAEYPLVHPDGRAADIRVLWDRLESGGGLVRTLEGELVTGLDRHGADAPDYSYASEVGRGTIEVITEPCGDLHVLKATHDAAMGRLLSAADEAGLVVLGYGVQPRTPPQLDLMTPKARYGVLLDVIGPDWLSFAVTASDQVQIDVCRDELIPFTEVGNLLAPLTVALCGNSSIAGGADAGACSVRDVSMGCIDADGGRHGMPIAPAGSPGGLVGRLLPLRFLMDKVDGVPLARTGPFADYLESTETDADDRWRAFLVHEHYVWHSARPRAAHGTIEMRAACQQPHDEHMASAALGLGIIEAGHALRELLADLLGADGWSRMRTWHAAVVRDGLRAAPPHPDLVPGVLECCQTALAARGRGEEGFLEPLWRRWRQRETPAQRIRDVFEAGGMAALVDRARFRR